MKCSNKDCTRLIVTGDIVHSVPESPSAKDHTAPMRAVYHDACAPPLQRLFIHMYEEPRPTKARQPKEK